MYYLDIIRSSPPPITPHPPPLGHQSPAAKNLLVGGNLWAGYPPPAEVDTATVWSLVEGWAGGGAGGRRRLRRGSPDRRWGCPAQGPVGDGVRGMMSPFFDLPTI